MLKIINWIRFRLWWSLGRIELVRCQLEDGKERCGGFLEFRNEIEIRQIRKLRSSNYYAIFINQEDTSLRVSMDYKLNQYAFVGVNMAMPNVGEVNDSSTPLPKFSKRSVALFVMQEIGFFAPHK
jgi:hypothetical protein